MVDFSAATVAREATKAGYILPTDSEEDSIRREVSEIPDAATAENHLFSRVPQITNGVNLSPGEAIHFLEGVKIEEILAARWHINENVTAPCELSREGLAATQKELSENNSATEFGGREMAYCLSCQCERPIVYGHFQQPTMAGTINLGGPINPTRIMSETVTQTFCAVCNHRVFTDAEIGKLKEEERADKNKWMFVGSIFLIAIIIIVAAILSAEN